MILTLAHLLSFPTCYHRADTLYLCYAIDHASNDEHCPKAAEAFTLKPSDASDSILPL